PRFLAFNTLGAALWVGVWSAAGYLAGDHIGAIYSTVTRYSLYLLIAVAVLFAAWVVRAVWRRRQAPARAAADRKDPARAAADRKDPARAAADRKGPAPRAADRKDPAPQAADRKDPAPQAADRKDPAPQAAERKDPVPEAVDPKEL